MKHYKITYDSERKKLILYHNDKIIGGMIGKIAEERWKAIQPEIEKIDVLKQIGNGHKAKTPKV